MSSDPLVIPVQMGLFGGDNALVGLHLVSAHTRLLADGSEVFVGEHLRWNRGRTGVRRGPRPVGAPDDAQIPLFAR